MFKDHSLLPAEAVRLAALGLLAEGPRRYGDLAAEIRHFIGLAVGPSLDAMGSSIELLRYEGLAAVLESAGDTGTMTLTAAGRTTLTGLLQAPVRAPNNASSRLVLLLKLRFLHHLEDGDRAAQRAQIVASLEQELTRLEELRRLFAAGAPALRDWLDRDIADLGGRIEHFRRAG